MPLLIGLRTGRGFTRVKQVRRLLRCRFHEACMLGKIVDTSGQPFNAVSDCDKNGYHDGSNNAAVMKMARFASKA
jgi:hypothetical protein